MSFIMSLKPDGLARTEIAVRADTGIAFDEVRVCRREGRLTATFTAASEGLTAAAVSAAGSQT
ncbi:MAG: hypothetical protein ACRD68_18120, partial [Pyrinomonadaceae bacterium]